ncbi:MBL fold metallo-hydrolase [Aminobacter sp. LjRoot7]|uniref:MBL fold metallo-hydrolase n=1 Tax=Aminobacter sp. LjRoot7 TaxID=3342335 RepID=UPI003ECFAA7A
MHAALSFAQPVPPAPGRTIEVADGIFWARLPLPFQLDHVNVYLLEDDGGWTVIDTGTDSLTNHDHWNQLLAETVPGRPLRRVIVTHFHPDHVGVAGWLCRSHNVPLVMTESELALAQRMLATEETTTHARFHSIYRLNGMEPDLADQVVANGHDYHRWVSELPDEVTILHAGEEFRIGKRNFRLMVGGGHSPEHAMLYDAEGKVLICADQVLARISPNISIVPSDPEGNPLSYYLDSLEMLRREVPDSALVLPGHDIPFHGLHARAQALRLHHESRCAAIVAACRHRRLSARELVPHTFLREFDHRQIGFALTETIAHVNLLLATRQLSASVIDEVKRFTSI